jgi:hypothetical protein
MDFDIQVAHSITQVDPVAWDSLAAGRPLASWRWYAYGEQVMADCKPVYILLSQGGKPVARGIFWVIWNEPLPIAWTPVRNSIHRYLKRRPLFVCRAPLANLSGLILPEPPRREAVLQTLVEAARQEAKKEGASFLLFDYLDKEQANWNEWRRQFTALQIADPGTRLEIGWQDFEAYLAGLSQKTRKHYRQYTREAASLGITVKAHEQVPDIEAAMGLIRRIERKHGASPNPWTRRMLEAMGLVNATWWEVRREGRLLGCELVLEDNGTRMVTALGLAEEAAHAYFLLGYADLREAIESGSKVMRWGSGAYEAKKRMGFRLEENNFVVFQGLGGLPRFIGRLARLMGR